MLFRFPTGSLPSFGDRTNSGVFQVQIEVAERSEGVLIGRGFHTDVPDGVPIYLPLADRRKPTYVIGKTGVGKTQFLLNMIMQDISGGFGVCVIDPHGDLYDDVLSRYLKSRLDDLVVFDPADPQNPPGLNLFEHDRRNLLERDFVLDETVSIFLKLFGKEIFGPRLQNYFRNGAMALMNDPSRDRTLLDIARLFIDHDFFEYIMRSVSDPSVKDFLDEIRKTGSREKEEIVPYFQSKFTPFVSNRIIRAVIGQPKSTVNFKSAMEQNKVVLINLSKGKLGELNSRLIGMVLISKLAWSALSRANVPPAERREFFVFCDEFQSFATESFLVILSEARKYGLCLTVANQYIKQLQIMDNYTQLDRDSLRDAVFGNVANLIAFRAGAGDAGELAKQLGVESGSSDVWKTQLMNQPAFHAIVKLDCEGVSTHPFSVESIPPQMPTDEERAMGAKAGTYAKMIHQLPVQLIDWETKKSRTDFYGVKLVGNNHPDALGIRRNIAALVETVPGGKMPAGPIGFFGRDLSSFETPIKLPAHTLNINEKKFLGRLAGSVSLMKDEKKRIIEAVPRLTQQQVDELMRILEEEQQNLSSLDMQHKPELDGLEARHAQEWAELEMEMTADERVQAESSQAEEHHTAAPSSPE